MKLFIDLDAIGGIEALGTIAAVFPQAQRPFQILVEYIQQTAIDAAKTMVNHGSH